MVTAPLGVIQHQLNLAGQNVLTLVSWALTLVLLVLTIELGRRERTPFYVLIVVASMVGAFAERCTTRRFALLLLDAGHAELLHRVRRSAADLDSQRLRRFCTPCRDADHYRIRNGGLTPKALYGWAGIVFGMSCVFEMTGINIGTYTYWGPHAFRVSTTRSSLGCSKRQTMCFAVAAAQLRQRTSSRWGLLGLFVLFPATFFGANFGAGSQSSSRSTRRMRPAWRCTVHPAEQSSSRSLWSASPRQCCPSPFHPPRDRRHPASPLQPLSKEHSVEHIQGRRRGLHLHRQDVRVAVADPTFVAATKDTDLVVLLTQTDPAATMLIDFPGQKVLCGTLPSARSRRCSCDVVGQQQQVSGRAKLNFTLAMAQRKVKLDGKRSLALSYCR